MLTVTTVLFDPNAESIIPERSRVYSPHWVDKLYRGCARNLTVPFRFLCLTHYPRSAFAHPEIEVAPFLEDTRQVMCLTEVFRPDLGIDRGFFIALDTVILRNIDHMTEYRGDFALPKLTGPSEGYRIFYNPVALYHQPAVEHLWTERHRAHACYKNKMWEFGASEMRYWARGYRGEIDNVHKLWSLHVTSYQWWTPGKNGRGDTQEASPEEVAETARIIYFFGEEKPHNTTLQVAREHWM